MCALTSSRLDSFSVFVTHILAVMITKFFFFLGGGGKLPPLKYTK